MSIQMSPFDFVKNINTKSEYMDNLQGYEPYIINHAFSNTSDSALFANEMNKYYHLPKVMQYDFYYYGLDKRANRFGKWYKDSSKALGDIDLIKEYYQCSYQKAKTALTVLTKEQVNQIKHELYRGGKTKKVKGESK